MSKYYDCNNKTCQQTAFETCPKALIIDRRLEYDLLKRSPGIVAKILTEEYYEYASKVEVKVVS